MYWGPWKSKATMMGLAALRRDEGAVRDLSGSYGPGLEADLCRPLPSRSTDPGYEFSGVNVECSSDLEDVVKRQVRVAALNLPEV